MPIDMSVPTTLNADETKLISIMRGFLDGGSETAPHLKDDPLLEIVEAPLTRFISYIWQSDPYVVKLNKSEDHSVTLFELQLLYAISEARMSNDNTVAELLAWWLPRNLMESGKSVLAMIADLLSDYGMECQSSARLRMHILTTLRKGVQSNRMFVLDLPISDTQSSTIQNTKNH
ncbi:MAG: hypothetical protein CMM76_12310 [Rhodospirillaceae bacterium]|nr:hypothetical protein [Rhodospirillaceae bacterium]|tara:strand:+ start:265 stop:789 length:525 start_codon:yes stop_codon:yes gene_type:complete